MINPKVLGISAFVGFFMSFLIGIFAGIPFVHLLLRAGFCAALFAAIAAGVSFLFQKFLFEAGSEAAVNTESRGETAKTPKTGGVVDITVEDETIPEDSDGPQFFVENNRPSFRNDVHASSATSEPAEQVQPEVHDKPVSRAPEPVEAENTFVPLDFSAAPKADPEPVAEKHEEQPVAEDLDELPDIADLSPSAGSGNSDGVIRDSDFASSAGPGQKKQDFTGSSDGSGQDSTVMAQAIRTLLAKDKGN